jgi:prophage regulatory protein
MEPQSIKAPRRANPQDPAAANIPGALLRIQVVQTVTGLSAPTIYRKVARGEFPEPVRLGARCTRWRSGDLSAWVSSHNVGSR